MLYRIIVLVLQKLSNNDHIHTTENYLVIRYADVDDDYQSDFRCPFCDFEIQVPLCSGFEEEYCSSPKNVV